MYLDLATIVLYTIRTFLAGSSSWRVARYKVSAVMLLGGFASLILARYFASSHISAAGEGRVQREVSNAQASFARLCGVARQVAVDARSARFGMLFLSQLALV